MSDIETYRKLFEGRKFLVSDPKIIVECSSLAKQFGYEEESEFVDVWECFSVENQCCPLTLANFERFKQYLTRNHISKKKKREPTNNVIYNHHNFPKKVKNSLFVKERPALNRTPVVDSMDTTTATGIEPEPVLPAEVNPTTSNIPLVKKAGDTLSTPGPQAPQKEGGVKLLSTYSKSISKRVSYNSNSIIINGDQTVTNRYKYMWEKINDISMALEHRKNESSSLLIKNHKLESPVDFHFPSQETTISVGMVCSEKESGILAQFACLESSHDQSGIPHRAKIDLLSLTDYKLFPGQMIAVKGTNPYGTRIIAQDIYSNASKPLRNRETANLKELRVVVAAGPYTHQDSIDYRYIRNLGNYVNQIKADLLILMGPFVDVQNKLINECKIECSFSELFKREVLGSLDPNFEIILIPSLRDVHHDNIFPQPPFKLRNLDKVRSFSNPSTIVINEVSFGICNIDILKHLSLQSLTLKDTPSPHILAEELIKQSSYYPLWPGFPDSSQLVSSHYSYLSMPYTPDVLLLSSSFSPFVNDSLDCLCVNVGQPDQNGRPFIVLNVDPPSSINDSRPASKRCQVEIFSM